MGVLCVHIVRGQLLNNERGRTLEAALEGGEMIFKGWQWTWKLALFRKAVKIKANPLPVSASCYLYWVSKVLLMWSLPQTQQNVQPLIEENTSDSNTKVI